MLNLKPPRHTPTLRRQSVEADWKIFQVNLRIDSSGDNPGKRPIHCLKQFAVVFPHSYPDPFTKVSAFAIGAATKLATVFRGFVVEPNSERQTIAKSNIDFGSAQGRLQGRDVW